MTKAEYKKLRNRILKTYDSIRKQWAQASGEMHMAILQEKNDHLAELAKRYHA